MGASSIEDPYLTNTKIASFPTWKTPDARVGVPLMSVMRQPSLQYLRKTTTQLSFDAILKRQAFIAQLLGGIMDLFTGHNSTEDIYILS